MTHNADVNYRPPSEVITSGTLNVGIHSRTISLAQDQEGGESPVKVNTEGMPPASLSIDQ